MLAVRQSARDYSTSVTQGAKRHTHSKNLGVERFIRLILQMGIEPLRNILKNLLFLQVVVGFVKTVLIYFQSLVGTVQLLEKMLSTSDRYNLIRRAMKH